MERVIMGMVGEDSADDIVESPMREMLGGLEPAGVTFWSGAGISMAPPTSLLGGIELTEKLIEWAFDDAPLDALVGTRGQDGRRQRTGLYAELGIDRVMPRLEVVLGVASEPGCHGKLAFDFVLGPMAAVEPNAAHRFLHAHVSRGGHHMTANFDTCIERAGPDDVRDSVLHFHGSVDDEAETLGATFRNIENGFKPDVEHSFLRFLTAAKTVIVVGYSGSDVFDVARLLGELADNGQPLKSVRVLWVDYADHCIELAPEWSPPDDVLGSVEAFLAEERVPWTARQIDSLRDAGADVRRVVGDPAEIYEFLTSAWQLEIDPTKPTAAAPTPTPMSIPKAEEDGRISAAVRLWLTLGVPRRALNLMEANPTLFPSAEIQEARAAIAWRSGRYRTAAKIWRSARPRGTAAERAAWSERQVACLWVAGRFVPALVLARLAIRRAIDNDVVNVELYELWARILQHMRRTPDLKLIGRWGQRKAVVELV